MDKVNGNDLKFEEVGEVEYFRERARRVEVLGRKAIWYYQGTFYATDANCYHSSGHLENHVDDIEEICGQPCVRCPQHKYIISIQTGESFYEAVDVVEDKDTKKKKMVPLGWKSKGLKQRTHSVKVENNKVYVKLNDSKDEFASDQYAYN